MADHALTEAPDEVVSKEALQRTGETLKALIQLCRSQDLPVTLLPQVMDLYTNSLHAIRLEKVEPQHTLFKIKTFIQGELALREARRCLELDLLCAFENEKEELLCRWKRADGDEFIAGFPDNDTFSLHVLNIVEKEATLQAPEKLRFRLRTRQHLGGRVTMTFVLSGV
jgi:hypothetical protein